MGSTQPPQPGGGESSKQPSPSPTTTQRVGATGRVLSGLVFCLLCSAPSGATATHKTELGGPRMAAAAKTRRNIASTCPFWARMMAMLRGSGPSIYAYHAHAQALGPSRRPRHLLLKKIDLSSPRWLPANGRPPPCPRSVPLPAMACPAAPPRDQAPRRRGSVGREGLSSGRSPLSSVADGAGAPAHRSAEQPDRPLAAAHRRGAGPLADIP